MYGGITDANFHQHFHPVWFQLLRIHDINISEFKYQSSRKSDLFAY